MNSTTIAPLDPPRVIHSNELRVLGLNRHYICNSNAGNPSQWADFVPHIVHIETRHPDATYSVIYNAGDLGNFDYFCGGEVSTFPAHSAELTHLTISAQTYAVFEHRNHALRTAGYQTIPTPCFERYGEGFNPHTGLGGLEIWVPIKTS